MTRRLLQSMVWKMPCVRPWKRCRNASSVATWGGLEGTKAGTRSLPSVSGTSTYWNFSIHAHTGMRSVKSSVRLDFSSHGCLLEAGSALTMSEELGTSCSASTFGDKLGTSASAASSPCTILPVRPYPSRSEHAAARRNGHFDLTVERSCGGHEGMPEPALSAFWGTDGIEHARESPQQSPAGSSPRYLASRWAALPCALAWLALRREVCRPSLAAERDTGSAGQALRHSLLNSFFQALLAIPFCRRPARDLRSTSGS
mmetsp:Transcript_31761/g.91279  ORF Transcript_31761/g.91279 Transcript_31761/m.91279 type:complete len:258 (-) Transcript_31761:1112-1885(-)